MRLEFESDVDGERSLGGRSACLISLTRIDGRARHLADSTGAALVCGCTPALCTVLRTARFNRQPSSAPCCTAVAELGGSPSEDTGYCTAKRIANGDSCPAPANTMPLARFCRSSALAHIQTRSSRSAAM